MLLGGVHRAPLFEKRREIVRRIVEVLLVAGGWRRLPVAAHYADRAVAACRGDTTCRELAPGGGDLLGQPVVVENRPGEGSIRPNITSKINDLSVTYLTPRYSIGTGAGPLGN